MSRLIATVAIRDEQDVAHVRQRARLIAELLGFDRTDQTRVSTAVSEIARNGYQYGGGGDVTFALDDAATEQVLTVTVRDQGPGIADLCAVLDGSFVSPAGMGLGIAGTRRLMDHFSIKSAAGVGTTVSLGKTLPASAPRVTSAALGRVADLLAGAEAESPLEQSRLQNRELLQALVELRRRQHDLEKLNEELDDTNRGVLALYAELDDKAVQLGHASEVKARFLSDMSHEFRTPLNSILALSELLLERVDGELTAEQEKQVAFIRDGAANLSELVNDLLDLARIGAGRTLVRARPCTVRELISGLRGMLKPLAVSPAVDLVFDDVDDDMPELFTDDGKVSQILRNFISNALKFTERGTVRVRAALSADRTAVVFRVADTGIGLSAEDQQAIFEEYAQVEHAQRRGTRGAGLGLPISRRLAEMLGGSVAVESEPAVGSTFSAVIPLSYAPVREGTAALCVAAADPTRAPILLVEDDAATQLLYERYLRGSGFHLICAGTLAEARVILETTRPQAIVLDILLPDGESWSLLGELKAAPATRDIPVFITTVIGEPDRGLAMGAEDYAVKPVAREWLLEKLNALARRPPRQTVLIVDDEEVARYILKGHLAHTDYRVIEASGGGEGLRLAAAEQPDVIFLDLMMPDMSGQEVLHRLKSDPAVRHIPVIIMTSLVLGEEERTKLTAEAFAILSKKAPTREAALAEIVDALHRAAAARAEEAGDE